jgi:hypothetical protein
LEILGGAVNCLYGMLILPDSLEGKDLVKTHDQPQILKMIDLKCGTNTGSKMFVGVSIAAIEQVVYNSSKRRGLLFTSYFLVGACSSRGFKRRLTTSFHSSTVI